MDYKRRDVLKVGSAAFSGLVCCDSSAGTQASSDFEVPISGYSHAILPRGHGQLIKLEKKIRRRYPSRDHCMQLAAFVSTRKALVVFSTDPAGGVSDWEITPGRSLRLRFYGSPPNVRVMEVDPNLASIAAPYRSWAIGQYWATRRRDRAPKISVFSVGSNPNLAAQLSDSWEFLKEFEAPRGLWLTQWRKYKFDTGYPDYAPNSSTAFRDLLAECRKNEVSVFPYINGLLFDNATVGSVGNRNYSLERGLRGSIPYSKKKHTLRYACPESVGWQSLILGARRSLLDSNNFMSEGVYYDMMMAATPIICTSSQHDHEPGDPYSWQRGIRRILHETEGLIMSEGCAEVYLDLVDYCLMHEYTEREDLIPLWAHVYGDISNPVGWKVNQSDNISQMKSEISRASGYCARSLGSPWMSSAIERRLVASDLNDMREISRRESCQERRGTLDKSSIVEDA